MCLCMCFFFLFHFIFLFGSSCLHTISNISTYGIHICMNAYQWSSLFIFRLCRRSWLNVKLKKQKIKNFCFNYIVSICSVHLFLHYHYQTFAKNFSKFHCTPLNENIVDQGNLIFKRSNHMSVEYLTPKSIRAEQYANKYIWNLKKRI